MHSGHSMAAHLKYGQDLLNSGLSGLREGSHDYLQGKPVSIVLGTSALQSLGLAVIGACAAFLPLSMSPKHQRARRSVALGATGCALGFCTAFAWKTRELASSMATAAKKKIEFSRDQHWLERNPIDYA